TRSTEALAHAALADVYRDYGDGPAGADEVAARYVEEGGGLEAGAAWLRHVYLGIGADARHDRRPALPCQSTVGHLRNHLLTQGCGLPTMEDPLTAPDLRAFVAACWRSAASRPLPSGSRPYIVRLPDRDRAQATLPVVVVPAEDALALTGLGRRPGQGSYWMRGGGDDGDRGDRGEGADFASIAELAAAPGWPDDEGALRGALASAESLVR